MLKPKPASSPVLISSFSASSSSCDSILPAKTPRESGLDLDFFAQNFELTGSQIKDVLLNAAFMAAQQGTVLCNEHIKEALCMNYNRVGKTLTKNDFGYLG